MASNQQIIVIQQDHPTIKVETNPEVVIVQFRSRAGTPGANGANYDLSAEGSVAELLDALTGEITASQLYHDLTSRIDLIDLPITGFVDVVAMLQIATATLDSDFDALTGTVGGLAGTMASLNASMATLSGTVSDLLGTPAYDAEVTYPAESIVTYLGGLYKSSVETLGNLPTNVSYWDKIGDYASLGDAVIALAAAFSDYYTKTEDDALLAGLSETILSTVSGNVAAILTDYSTIASTESAISEATISILASAAGSVASALTSYYTKTSADQAVATAKQEAIASAAGSLASALLSYYTKSGVDGAIASAKISVLATSDQHTASSLSSYTSTTDMNTAIGNAVIGAVSTSGSNADSKIANALTSYYTKTTVDSAVAGAQSGAIASAGQSLANALTNYYTKATVDSSIASASQGAVTTAGQNAASALTNYYTKSAADGAISTAKSEAISASGSAADTKVANALLSYYTKTNADYAISQAQIGTLASANNNTSQAIGAALTNYYSKSTVDSNISSAVGTVSSRLNNIGGVTVEQVASTTAASAGSITTLNAKYGVKLDVNGKVSGFGLNSSDTASAFEIAADRFAICNTSGTGTLVPFIVDSGVVYIASAAIKDLNADKLKSGTTIVIDGTVDGGTSVIGIELTDTTKGGIRIKQGSSTNTTPALYVIQGQKLGSNRSAAAAIVGRSDGNVGVYGMGTVGVKGQGSDVDVYCEYGRLRVAPVSSLSGNTGGNVQILQGGSLSFHNGSTWNTCAVNGSILQSPVISYSGTNQGFGYFETSTLENCTGGIRYNIVRSYQQTDPNQGGGG